MENVKEQFESFQKEILEKRKPDLSIARMPGDYCQQFKDIAFDEFAGDYGMTLRDMIRTWKGIYISSNNDIELKIEVLSEEIEELKHKINELAKSKEQPEKGHMTASGKRIN